MHLQWLIPAWAWPVLLAVALASAVWIVRTYRRTVPAPTVRWRRLLVGLRLAATVAVLLALARPLLVLDRTTSEPAVVAVVLEDSGSMALADRADRPTRWRQAVTLAAAVDSAVTARQPEAEVVVLRGNGKTALRQTDLVSARIDTPRAVGSDLPALVARAGQRLLARPLRGLVVATDGHSDHDGQPRRASQAPLWLVGVGDPEGQADRALVDLRHPDRVHAGEPLVVELAVRQRLGRSARDSMSVRLRRDGETVAEQRAVVGEFSRFELTWTPSEPGLAVLEVEVSSLDNERFLANNRATIAVDVEKDRSRLLLLASGAGWDGRFLAQAALAEPRLSLTIVQPGPEGPVLADSLVRWQAPLTAADWRERWDGVVLAGPPGSLVPDGGVELAGAVRQGLGLLVLALDAGGGDGRRWSEPLAEVLPVTAEPARLRRGEFAVELAPEGRGHPVLAELTAGDQLAQMPPLELLAPARARPTARPLLKVGPLPVLVASDPGDGRALWFGARRLWELAFWQRPTADATSDQPGRRLLRQMLLWTALGDESGGVALLGRQRAFEEGEAIPVAVRWRDLRGDPVADAASGVEVRRPGEVEGTRHALRPDPRRPGVATGVLPPLPPGRWQLVPRGESDPVVEGAPREIVVTQAASEAAQVRQDWRNLRLVAGRLGATSLSLDQPDGRAQLLNDLERLDLEPRESVLQTRFEPAASWWWLAVTAGLLGAEWFLRRRRGLI